MNRRYSRRRPELLTGPRRKYKMGGMFLALAKDIAGSASVLMDLLGQGFSNIAQYHHNKFLKLLNNQWGDYTATVAGRNLTAENNLALQSAKDYRLQQTLLMTDTMQQGQNIISLPKMFYDGGPFGLVSILGSICQNLMPPYGGIVNWSNPLQGRLALDRIANMEREAPLLKNPFTGLPLSQPAALSTPALGPVLDTEGGSVDDKGTSPGASAGMGSMLLSGMLSLDNGLGLLVSGDYKNDVGNFILNIPGLGLVGGLINRSFGIKTNEAEVNRVKGDNTYLANQAALAGAATSFDDAALSPSMTVNTSANAYKGGWFRKGTARGKNRALTAQLKTNLDFANRAAEQGILNVQEFQDDNLAKTFAAYGGPLFAFGGDLQTHGANFDTGITLVSNGGTHEANPYEGVPMGVDPQGVPNLVEEGEVIFNDYVFSNRLKVPKAIRNKYKLKGNKSLTFADAAMLMAKESEERPNDPISKNGLEALLGELAYAQEDMRVKKQERKTYAYGGKFGNIFEGSGDASNVLRSRKPRFRDSKTGNWVNYDTLDEALDAGIDLSEYGTPVEGEEYDSYTKLGPGKEMPDFDNWMRYAPIDGSLIGLGLSLFSKPDESGAEAILEAAKGAGTYQPVSFTPVGNYLTYRPFDLEYAATQANAESAAARRALMNTSGGNRAAAMAGILAANNNALNQLGILRRGAAEDNLKQRQLVEDFNRSTNMFNSEGFLKADMANQSAAALASESFLKGVMAAEETRLNARLAREKAIQSNLSSLFTSLGNIGQEEVTRQQMKWMVDNGFVPGYEGTEGKEEKKGGSNSGTMGGKIKRKRKGLTY